MIVLRVVGLWSPDGPVPADPVLCLCLVQSKSSVVSCLHLQVSLSNWHENPFGIVPNGMAVDTGAGVMDIDGSALEGVRVHD